MHLRELRQLQITQVHTPSEKNYELVYNKIHRVSDILTKLKHFIFQRPRICKRAKLLSLILAYLNKALNKVL